MNTLARLVSVLFHPLLMATYLFLILSWALPSALAPLQQDSHMTFIALVFIVTFLLPLLNLGIFKVFGTINSFAMETRRERIIPFAFMAVIYVAITVLLYTRRGVSADDNFLKLLTIMNLLVIVSFIATLFFKVSIHSVGIWGVVAITFSLTKISEVNSLFYISLALIVLAGIIMSARLQLGAHTPREVMLGAVLGLATGLSGMLMFF